ncbi:Hypothetical predicted protein [Lecanosticta acicola]|uniref:Carboxylic ester hydrolase n=1 Tax=Lecanosticta acicola TaxID=111012 RepID=A0AAI8W1F4_9PEZI|nr:Hypothetical predicted protein [Lecanosticta acicola]
MDSAPLIWILRIWTSPPASFGAMMRWALTSIVCAACCALAHTSCPAPVAKDGNQVVYEGFYRDQVETFLGIRYAEDTGGPNRFKPPIPYQPSPGTNIKATETGPACPQPTGAQLLPLYLGNITTISEDCLRLNVIRPNGTHPGSNLPVLVFIHGGSFIAASKDDPVAHPGGLILESVANGHPVMHVALNYRLGVFGFAQSASLQQEGSENAGVRDQRLALEWVQHNIAGFGGNPNNVTIHGQSSGGLAMGIQTVAYGASKPAPFQQFIAQSQALEGGITGNFTRKAMNKVANATGCNTTDIDSAATVSCFRALSMEELLQAQTDTHGSGPAENVGDEWLPVVDGDFLPAAPSELIGTGRVYNVSAIAGWCNNDAVPFVSLSSQTPNGTYEWFKEYLPDFTLSNLNKLLDLYPSSEFPPSRSANGSVEVSTETLRAARILRDIVFVCQAVFLGEALQKSGNSFYLYDQNQTFVTDILASEGSPGEGPVHTSEFAYMFGNLSHYNVYDFPFYPNATDYALRDRESRSWSSFVATGNPSLENKTTLKGWKQADLTDENLGVYIIGSQNEGYSGLNGSSAARRGVEAQKLKKRCEFLNQPDVIKQQGY